MYPYNVHFDCVKNIVLQRNNLIYFENKILCYWIKGCISKLNYVNLPSLFLIIKMQKCW